MRTFTELIVGIGNYVSIIYIVLIDMDNINAINQIEHIIADAHPIL